MLRQRQFYFWGLLLLYLSPVSLPPQTLFLCYSYQTTRIFLFLHKPCFLMLLNLCIGYFHCLERYYSFIKQFLNNRYLLGYLRIWYDFDMIPITLMKLVSGSSPLGKVPRVLCPGSCMCFTVSCKFFIESTIHSFPWHCCLSTGWMNKISQGMWFLRSDDFFFKDHLYPPWRAV